MYAKVTSLHVRLLLDLECYNSNRHLLSAIDTA